MDRLKTLAGSIGMARLAMMGAVGALLLGLLAWVAVSGGTSDKAFLFTDLDPAAAADIAQKLTAAGVDYELTPDGTAVMAPRSRIAELRMSMAGEQLGGKLSGYELLDAEQPFGLSSSREKLNATRALEGELARSIGTLQPVKSARVHIVMPERALFAAEGRKATASVTVKTRSRLSGENVTAIRSLVSAAVPELSPEAVSIVDQSGRLLARAGENAAGGDMDERQIATEQRLRSQIEALIEPIVGAGKVRAEVAAELVREAVRSEAKVYDPDRQVIARQVSVESGNQTRSAEGGNGAVSVSQQLPDAQADPAAGGQSEQANATETSDDTSYENSATQTVTVTTPGAIRRLSVAVTVDGGKKGLPPATLQRIQRLVEGAIGFDAQRGDKVAVESMAFAEPDAEEGLAASIMDNLPTGALFDIAKLLVIAAVGFFVIRALRPRPGEGAPGTIDGGAIGADGQPAAGGAQGALTYDRAEGMAKLDQELAMDQVEGGIKAASLKRLSEAIATNPAESASVIRKWMNA